MTMREIETVAMPQPTMKRLKGLTGMDQWFRIWLPYQFVQLEMPKHKHVYLPVNRNYKPLGVVSEEFVDYDDFLDQAVIFRSDPHEFVGVWNNPDGLYLYDDGPESRRDYFVRLGRLADRSMMLVGVGERGAFRMVRAIFHPLGGGCCFVASMIVFMFAPSSSMCS